MHYNALLLHNVCMIAFIIACNNHAFAGDSLKLSSLNLYILLMFQPGLLITQCSNTHQRLCSVSFMEKPVRFDRIIRDFNFVKSHLLA